MVPEYGDISYFRAPYKLVQIAGFGQPRKMSRRRDSIASRARALKKLRMMSGYGEDLPGKPAVINPVDAVSVDKRGYRFVKDHYLALLDAVFSTHYGDLIVVDGKPALKLHRFTDEQLSKADQDSSYAAKLAADSAKRWIKDQVGSGQLVLVPMTTLAVLLNLSFLSAAESYPVGSDFIWSVAAGTEDAKSAASSGYGAVLAGDPDKAPFLAGLTGAGAIVLAAAIAGGVYLVVRKR